LASSATDEAPPWVQDAAALGELAELISEVAVPEAAQTAGSVPVVVRSAGQTVRAAVQTALAAAPRAAAWLVPIPELAELAVARRE